MSEAEADQIFDGVCRREMGISGEEFLSRWDAGEFADVDVDSVPGLVDVVMVLPLIRD